MENLSENFDEFENIIVYDEEELEYQNDQEDSDMIEVSQHFSKDSQAQSDFFYF